MAKITIHTATYNRAYILGQAYESLCRQTSKDFEWIITDDGSTDSTLDLVESWKSKDNGFPIIYNKLAHVGIPRALNSGIKKASTEWFMILDSDDYLKDEAIEQIIDSLKEIEKDTSFIGIAFARCHSDGSYMKNQVPIVNSKGYVDCSNIDRWKYNLDMDMVEVSRVAILKEYPFQFWPGEDFAPEQLNYNEIAIAGFQYRWYSKKIYVCEYLEDGQTKNDRIVKNNPMGFAMMHNQNMKIRKNLRQNIHSAIQMTALCLYAKQPAYLMKSTKPVLTLLTLPLGITVSFRRRRQFKRL